MAGIRGPLAILIGLATALALGGIASSWPVDSMAQHAWPFGFVVGHAFLDALARVLPGFVAGWYARERAWLVGACVGILIAFWAVVFALLVWGTSETQGLWTAFFAAALSSSVTNMAGAAAGQMLSRRRADV
jgi:hypothetical protein